MIPSGAGEHAHVLLCCPIPGALPQRELPAREAASHPVQRMPGLPAGWWLFLSEAWLGQDPGQFPGSEWELPCSQGSLAPLSASHLSLPAPLRRAPDDASARCCLANLANSTNVNCLRLVWEKTKGALMEGQGLSVSQAGQHPSGGLQPLPLAPRAAPLVVFLTSRPSPRGSSMRRGTLSSSTSQMLSEGPATHRLSLGGEAEARCVNKHTFSSPALFSRTLRDRLGREEPR